MSKLLSLLLAAALLGGCASLNRLSSDVSSFGTWPDGRRPASFVFDRLPSAPQRQQQRLEDAALPALTAAGFAVATDPSAADYVVQLGATVSSDDLPIVDFGYGGMFGWRAGWQRHYLGFGYGWGPAFGRFGGHPTPVYLREVVVLIRDRRSGRTVYETRASNIGYSAAIDSLLPAMFAAALADFPTTGGGTRRVVTPIG